MTALQPARPGPAGRARSGPDPVPGRRRDLPALSARGGARDRTHRGAPAPAAGSGAASGRVRRGLAPAPADSDAGGARPLVPPALRVGADGQPGRGAGQLPGAGARRAGAGQGQSAGRGSAAVRFPAGPAGGGRGRRRTGRLAVCLLLTLNHTALDGPACLRVLATPPSCTAAPPSPRLAAYAIPSARRGRPGPPPARAARRRSARPARVAPATDVRGSRRQRPAARRSAGAAPTGRGRAYTVNDQLLVATCLMIARWNRLHERPPAPHAHHHARRRPAPRRRDAHRQRHPSRGGRLRARRSATPRARPRRSRRACCTAPRNAPAP